MAIKEDSKIFDISVIKALSKEQRQNLAITIRRDSELWNAVNGFGGLSEFSNKSRLQGTVIENGSVAIGRKVSVINDDTSKELIAVTNQQGYYSIELEPAEYIVSLQSEASSAKSASGTSVETVQGETSTLDFGENSNSANNAVL